jgi:hypothetical protein
MSVNLLEKDRFTSDMKVQKTDIKDDFSLVDDSLKNNKNDKPLLIHLRPKTYIKPGDIIMVYVAPREDDFHINWVQALCTNVCDKGYVEYELCSTILTGLENDEGKASIKCIKVIKESEFKYLTDPKYSIPTDKWFKHIAQNIKVHYEEINTFIKTIKDATMPDNFANQKCECVYS